MFLCRVGRVLCDRSFVQRLSRTCNVEGGVMNVCARAFVMRACVACLMQHSSGDYPKKKNIVGVMSTRRLCFLFHVSSILPL